MNKKNIVLCFLPIILGLKAHAQQGQEFFLRTDAWRDGKVINCEAIEKQPEHKPTEAQHIILRTKTGLEIPALFFDRGSNVALVAGQALPAPKESMRVYAHLFDIYDVILFDYRWCHHYFSSLLKSILLCSPTKRMLLDEEEEIYAALDYLKKHEITRSQKYEKIVGLGECYSDFLLAKIQADAIEKTGKGPFTHLILDSCWHSFKSMAESICNDPLLPISPQVGGAPGIVKKCMGSSIVKWPVLKIIFTFLQDVCIEEYLVKLDIPVLFIYGRNDLFVLKHHFESIWKAAGKEKRAVFLTPYCHSNNLGNKPVYRFVCEQFVKAQSIAAFQENCEKLV
ncbi:MAG: hypothetical protein ABH827_06685 [bacterium]